MSRKVTKKSDVVDLVVGTTAPLVAPIPRVYHTVLACISVKSLYIQLTCIQ